VREEEASFIIYQHEETLQLSFFIVLEQDIGLSQYQINEEPPLDNNPSFQYSHPRHRSVV
jgi:hypothetical protein